MTRFKAWASAISVLAVFMSEPLTAHHSFPATYVDGEVVTIEGTIVQVLLRNPHSFVQVSAPGKDGKMVVWAVEWAASGALGDKVKPNTLRPGDKVIVKGNPARDAASHRLHMQSITRPSDGWKWEGTFG